MSYAKYISVALASMLKFIGGPLAGLALKLSWHETAVCSAVGMMASVLLVLFAGSAISQIQARYRKAVPRLFSKRTRLAVRIWQRAGLTGIALLTPILLTPIGGTALAISFRVPVPRIILAMLMSGSFWGIILSWGMYQIPGLFK
ncbi:MAG: hypothetical protein EOO39_30630 [Cytophagaceae bacterium]|nr:MAG: hypothetical protein EOO39_30630 [Cytophagaceae bacterium]